jgi:hypothetical protein
MYINIVPMINISIDPGSVSIFAELPVPHTYPKHPSDFLCLLYCSNPPQVGLDQCFIGRFH